MNPYKVLHNAKVDIYRHIQYEDESGFTKSRETLVCASVSARLSSSGQVAKGIPVPDIVNEYTLFMAISTDVRPGDNVIATMFNGIVINLEIGECHPYTHEWQCEAKRVEKA